MSAITCRLRSLLAPIFVWSYPSRLIFHSVRESHDQVSFERDRLARDRSLGPNLTSPLDQEADPLSQEERRLDRLMLAAAISSVNRAEPQSLYGASTARQQKTRNVIVVVAVATP